MRSYLGSFGCKSNLQSNFLEQTQRVTMNNELNVFVHHIKINFTYTPSLFLSEYKTVNLKQEHE